MEQIEVLKARLQQAEKRPNPRLETEFDTGVISGEPEDHLISLVFLNTWERGGARGLRQQIAQAEVQQATLDAEDYMRILTQSFLKGQILLSTQRKDRRDQNQQKAGELPLKTEICQIVHHRFRPVIPRINLY